MSYLVIFDCEGTLTDNQISIISAIKATFTQNQMVPPSDTKIRKFHCKACK